ncbi:aKG-HExxH-type peptide beta-hydroxylase [Rhizobium rhizogenes]|uniref:aKG-HExxH-type peptide beta-hydroxylase n=1 Tax=Rhizobium rhizogenes TaxID=359 RepID=UPI001297CC8C|nr:HEXXH motif-containing putative peptide modification protein [Rhizobium rhizogenes]MQB35116.1 hypothetical protein [Rhizobium rhizogenes]
MPHLILGHGAEAVLQHIGEQLQTETLALSNDIDGSSFKVYSPWMAGRPLWRNPPPALLLEPPPFTSGLLIIDEPYLRSVSAFLDSHPELLVELIGSRQDWAVAETVAIDRPEMAKELTEVVDHVEASSPFFFNGRSALVKWIVPLQQQRPRGWSLQSARGLIFLGYHQGYNHTDLALDLVHEMGHQALALFQSLDPIFASDENAPVYSEVRKTQRPAMQSLHAASAIAFMAKYLRDIGLPDHIHPDFRQSMGLVLRHAIDQLRLLCTFTSIGEQILSDFESFAD